MAPKTNIPAIAFIGLGDNLAVVHNDELGAING
ncbi:hypothetical protein BGP_6516 [Beggiatoa sp. PS]|nr:hypothetical protein BGP_6516 [Beggiatoa sp. PS]